MRISMVFEVLSVLALGALLSITSQASQQGAPQLYGPPAPRALEIKAKIVELADFERSLKVAEEKLVLAEHHRNVAMVALPVSVVTSIGGYLLVEKFGLQSAFEAGLRVFGIEFVESNLVKNPVLRSKGFWKVVDWIGGTGVKAAAAFAIGDTTYLLYYNPRALTDARVNIAFYTMEVHKTKLALETLSQNLKN
jgi:hypothetical protein